MDSPVFLLLALTGAGMLHEGWCITSVIGLYGETLEVPCDSGNPPPEGLIITKWKYMKNVGSSGNLLIKHSSKEEVTVLAEDEYAGRVAIAPNGSLLISRASMQDQRVFSCMMATTQDLLEYPVTVTVYKKPSSVEMTDTAKVLDKGKLTLLGTCVAKDSNPPAEVTWEKNGQLLVPDGKAVVVTSSVKMEPVEGLSNTYSTLHYTATKEDVGAAFTCSATHPLAAQTSAPQIFPVHYPTEKLNIQLLSKGPIVEGDNVTLICHADGSPPPSRFLFHLKGRKVLVEDSDAYTLADVTRDADGDYGCSLADDEKMEASLRIGVSYLDLSLSPTGTLLKKVGETVVVKMEKNASGDAQVLWTKDGKAIKAPAFGPLKYTDAGFYTCEVTTGGLRRSQSFQLVVEGTPVITSLIKQRAADDKHKVLICEALGVPEPSFQWSVNTTHEETSYVNGRATHSIHVVPVANLTVTCSVSNELGGDMRTIDVFSLFKEEIQPKGAGEDDQDQATLIVAIVAGLLIAAAVAGLVYWLYMKNSRQGTWKTNEKEEGTSEESKKLEENNLNV